MDYAAALPKLETLKDLIERLHSATGDDASKLRSQISEAYGEVSAVYASVAGAQRISVPPGNTKLSTIYPNLFEAAFLSGRTFHRHAGKMELQKVIGAVRAKAETGNAKPSFAPTGSRVFIVHGHDEAALQSVARFLEKLGLPHTILREQPNQGRTIIEKFLDYSDAAFAVVLLTGDDLGGPGGSPPESQSRRPRQNVIFELGFFLGKLGRDRVCALYESGVEVPSDYSGVLFVPLDAREAWRFELAREMKAAGLTVDLNRLA